MSRRTKFGLGILFTFGVVAGCSNGNDHGATIDAGGSAVTWPESDVTVGPLVSGTSSIIDGTFAWTDYVYDDRGPNSDAGFQPGQSLLFARALPACSTRSTSMAAPRRSQSALQASPVW